MWYIQGFNPFWVCLKTSEGFLSIPITQWKNSRFMILKSFDIKELKEEFER